MSDTPIHHVSDTALWVAAYRALESERPDALFKDPLASLVCGERGREIARAMPYPEILAWIMAVRTVVIDRLILEALGRGVDHVINLGAGLDTRPFRLELPAGLHWVELDFPRLIESKEKALEGQRPRCELRRIAVDLSDRSTARRIYAELGARAGSALIVTEGVIPYLSVEEAGQLAWDLRSIPTFRYWIQDYRKRQMAWRRDRRFVKKLRHAPFRFDHPDPLGFFAGKGWLVVNDILAVPEGERLGRAFPIPFPGNLLAWLLPEAKKREFRSASGYALLQADDSRPVAEPFP